MNLFGNSPVDGNGRLVRQIAIAGGIVAAIAVGAASFLDRAAKDGSLNSIAFWGNASDPARQMLNVPRASQQIGGVRYGDVDYMSTASIPGQKPRIKNVVSDPSLGLPN